MQDQSLHDSDSKPQKSGAETTSIIGVEGSKKIASLSRSEFTRYDHSFVPGERVRGSFVRFDKMRSKVYALFDLEDGRKTRVDIKYFKFLKGREAMFMPGDKVTMESLVYSSRLHQPSWFILSTPRRFDKEGFTIKYPTTIQQLLAPKDNWSEADSDFEMNAGVDGVIVRFTRTHGKRRFAIVDTENGHQTRVHRVSFEAGSLSIDDFNEGDHIAIVKKGFMPDRHTTKWQVFMPAFHYDENGEIMF